MTGLLATDRPAEIGLVDAVLFCVKLYDTEAAARLMRPVLGEVRPVLGEETFVVTVQNGVESAARIAAVIGPGRTLAGAAYFPANIVAPGEIAWLGRMAGKPLIAFGEPGEGPSPRAHAFAQVCNEAGVEAAVFDDTERMIWEKFCLMAGSSAATALARQPIGPVRSDPDSRWVLAQAIGEAAAVGRALGVASSGRHRATGARVSRCHPCEREVVAARRSRAGTAPRARMALRNRRPARARAWYADPDSPHRLRRAQALRIRGAAGCVTSGAADVLPASWP